MPVIFLSCLRQENEYKEVGKEISMQEVESRGLSFNSWKAYAVFLASEVRQLQQLLPSAQVEQAFEGAKRECQRKGVRGIDYAKSF